MAHGDPSVEALRSQVESLRAMGVEGRLRAAESLRAFAWELKTSVIAASNPDLSPAEIADRVRRAFGGGRL